MKKKRFRVEQIVGVLKQAPVVVPCGLEDNAHWMLQAMKKVSKQPELGCGVGQDHALAVLPSWRLDQDVVTQFGDIDGYQNGGRLSRLNKGHGWFSPVLQTGKADRECIRGKLQRDVPGRSPGHALVR